MLRLFTLLCLAVLLSNSAAAQECYSTDPEFVAQVAQAKEGQGKCSVKCQGCGCKGGPGYRVDRNGECVGWDDLLDECGDPPRQRCSLECTAVAVGCESPADAIDRFEAEKADEPEVVS